MDATQKLTIQFELVDKATAQATANLKVLQGQAKNTNDEATRGFQKFTEGLGQLETATRAASRAMLILGASIVAPLTLAVNTAAKSNVDLSEALVSVKENTNQLLTSIGNSLTPVIKEAAKTIQEWTDKWNALPEAQRDAIVQTAFVVAKWAIAIGVALKLAFEVEKLISVFIKLAGSPLGQVTVGLGLMVTSAALLVDKFAQLNKETLDFADRWNRIINVATGFANPGVGLVNFAQTVGMGLGQRVTSGGKQGGQGIVPMGGMPHADLGTISAQKQKAPNLKPAEDAWKQYGDSVKKIAGEVKLGWDQFYVAATKQATDFTTISTQLFTTTFDTFTKGIGQSVADAIVYGKNFGESMVNMLKSLAAQVIAFLVTTIAKIAVLRAMGVVGPISSSALGMGGGSGSAGTGAAGGGSGGGILSSIGHMFGFAGGGTINEPIAGIGLRSGSGYTFGERGPETITPMSGGGMGRGVSGGNVTVINISNPVIDDTNRINEFANKVHERLSRLNYREVRRA